MGSCENLDDWDPITESYYDESFNSYSTGAGSRLPRKQQPANFWKKESDCVKLYVFPLSEDYTRNSLHNIFQKFGQVTDVFIHNSYKWAFVSMKTMAAAERAICELSDDPQLKFKVQFAKEKSDSGSVVASENGSTSERNNRKSDTGTNYQTRNKFSDTSQRKSINGRSSMEERSVSEKSERLPLNFQISKTLLPVSEKKLNSKNGYQKSAITNNDIAYQTVPNCSRCKCQTTDTCIKCRQPFCSVDCMILGYRSHTDECVRVPLLRSQQNGPNNTSSTNGRPTSDLSPRKHQYFPKNGRNDLNEYDQPSADISNSRKSYYMNDLGAKYPKNNSQDVYDGRSVTSPNSRAFEKPRNNDLAGRNTSSDAYKSMDENVIMFNIDKDGNRNNRGKRESESSRNNYTQGSYYKTNNVSSRYNRSRISENAMNNADESSWDTQSQAPGYYSKRDITPLKNNRVSVVRSDKENKSPWENQSRVSGYESKMESTPSKANGSHEMGSPRWANKPKEFKDNRRFDRSPRSPSYPVNFCPKKPDLSSLFRVDIEENSKFEVKLAESGPPAVLITQESGSLNSMIDILQEYSLKPKEDLHKGQKCVAKKTADEYGTWFRGFIVEDDPLSVKFIDYSYERVQVRREDVRVIPEEFTSIVPFCYPVNFMNASIDEVNELKDTKFEVVFLSKEYGTWNVNLVEPLEGDSQDVRKSDSHAESRNFHRSRPDLKVNFRKGVAIEVFVTYTETRFNKIFVSVRDKLNKLGDLIADVCPNSPELEEVRLDTICLALFEGNWYRAKIVSTNPLEVYYLDFGNIDTVKKSDLKMLPEEIQKIDSLVVPVRFINGSKVDDNETVEIIPIEELSLGGVWMVRKSSEPEIVENENTLLEPNERFVNKSYAPKVALDEIIEVQVTHTISNTEYYVGLKNMDELLKMGITDEEIMELGPLKTPFVDMLCLKTFATLWSRAKIVNLQPLTIYYIDFGNEEEVRIEELYPLPEKYQRLPPIAFKIQLLEPEELPEYVPLKMKKITEKFWTVVY